jgi:SAM-dependent methyltransferase
VRAVGEPGWEWDETLYQGSARYYADGRLPYPQAMADALQSALALDGHGRLLDVGCGPGPVALLLAPLFEHVVGIDADAGMIEEATRTADRRGVRNAQWSRMRAEDLPAGLGAFRVATVAQSFHWMQRRRVARAVADMLAPVGGAWVHVHATTHRGDEPDDPLSAPAPPRDEIRQLVHRYLGPVRRAGQSLLPAGTPSDEEDVMVAEGYTACGRVVVPRHELFDRSEDEIVASVYSLSWAAPHLFGRRLPEFETELRRTLRATSPEGRFCERARDIELVIWRRPAHAAVTNPCSRMREAVSPAAEGSDPSPVAATQVCSQAHETEL